MPRLVTTPPPHLKAEPTVALAMKDVLIALIPISLLSVYFFEFYAVVTIFVGMATAVATELIFRKALGRKPSLNDYSALVTGLLVALCFAATTSWWTVALATFIGVGVGKELMGGLGWNRFNPALLGRASVFLLAPVFVALNPAFAGLDITRWNVDIMTQATPLAMLQLGDLPFSYWELFTLFPGGAIAEISPLALILGGLYLLYRGHITWTIPASILGTVLVLTTVLGENPAYHLLSGGLMLGAFYMATDWVTSPMDSRGQLIFGVAIGILVVVFRVALPSVGGVAFAILIMNAFVPLIDRLTKHPSFSEPRPAAAVPARE